MNNSRNDDKRNEKNPHSRLFVVCGKDIRDDDLRPFFEKFGEIEDLYMPRDRNTGETRGVAYIKYSKTSSAASAIQELHLKSIKGGSKPIKVLVASDKNDPTKEEKYNRLFIKILKQVTDSEIREYFSQFGEVESVHIQRDKATNESKGLAYVQFSTFLDAAKAFEGCDKKYRPVFASPKQELKRGRDNLGSNDSFNSHNSIRQGDYHDFNTMRNDMPMPKENIVSLLGTQPQNYNTVLVTCSPVVSQKHIERLCNIIPGMRHCQYTNDDYNGLCNALVTYADERAAAYAVNRLNNFEFPSGEILTVKPDNPLSKAATELKSIVNSFKNAVDAGSTDLVQLANAIAQASTLIKEATTGNPSSKIDSYDADLCSVLLPPPQPLASTSRVAQRCFIICKPQPPPNHILREVFSRFGDLIDVSTFPNKTFGFVKYASARAAQDAINTLHGAYVGGTRIKVLVADEKTPRDEDVKMNIDTDHESMDKLDAKKKRLDSESD